MLHSIKSFVVVLAIVVGMVINVSAQTYSYETAVLDDCNTLDGWALAADESDDGKNPVVVSELVVSPFDGTGAVAINAESNPDLTGNTSRYLHKTYDFAGNTTGTFLKFDAVFAKTGNDYYNSPFIIIKLIAADGSSLGVKVIFTLDTISRYHTAFIRDLGDKYIVMPTNNTVINFGLDKFGDDIEFAQIKVVLAARIGNEGGTCSVTMDNLNTLLAVADQEPVVVNIEKAGLYTYEFATGFTTNVSVLVDGVPVVVEQVENTNLYKIGNLDIGQTLRIVVNDVEEATVEQIDYQSWWFDFPEAGVKLYVEDPECTSDSDCVSGTCNDGVCEDDSVEEPAEEDPSTTEEPTEEEPATEEPTEEPTIEDDVVVVEDDGTYQVIVLSKDNCCSGKLYVSINGDEYQLLSDDYNAIVDGAVVVEFKKDDELIFMLDSNYSGSPAEIVSSDTTMCKLDDYNDGVRMSFEDVRPENGGDNDFNDLVLWIGETTAPATVEVETDNATVKEPAESSVDNTTSEPADEEPEVVEPEVVEPEVVDPVEEPAEITLYDLDGVVYDFNLLKGHGLGGSLYIRDYDSTRKVMRNYNSYSKRTAKAVFSIDAFNPQVEFIILPFNPKYRYQPVSMDSMTIDPEDGTVVVTFNLKGKNLVFKGVPAK